MMYHTPLEKNIEQYRHLTAQCREVLALFAKTRTHIRIKDLNKALIRREAHSLSMRDLKQQGQLVYYKLAEEFFNS